MRTLMTCLVLCGFSISGTVASAQTQNLTDLKTPTEVGTTTIPSGNYIVTDSTTGKSYPLTVTKKGTMIIEPASAAGKKTLGQEMKQGVNNMIKKEGIGELENAIK